MKECALCRQAARMYCESDRASLCWDCDAKVHGANFLVARHTRCLLCRACQAPTPWKASGSRLGPTVSVCEKCAGGGCREADEERPPHRNDVAEEEMEVETDSDEDDDDDDDEEEEEEDGENQVVPWSNAGEQMTQSPPVASSSSSDDSSSSSSGCGYVKRRRRSTDEGTSRANRGCSPSYMESESEACSRWSGQRRGWSSDHLFGSTYRNRLI